MNSILKSKKEEEACTWRSTSIGYTESKEQKSMYSIKELVKKFSLLPSFVACTSIYLKPRCTCAARAYGICVSICCLTICSL